MDQLTTLLNFKKNEVITVIGSGGKTSFIWLFAEHFKNKKVMVTTTTKMGIPNKKLYDYFFTTDDVLDKNLEIKNGINFFGEVNDLHTKISALPNDILNDLMNKFDKVLIEGDGSKMLPLKAWEDFEPVIPDQTTITIGIVPINSIGLKANKNTVHRLPLFLKMLKISIEDEITFSHIAYLISNPNALMKKAKGQKIICINQVDTKEDLQQAKKLVTYIPKEFLNNISAIIATSILKNQGEILYQR